MHSLEAQAEAIMIYQAILKETVPQIGFWQKKKKKHIFPLEASTKGEVDVADT